MPEPTLTREAWHRLTLSATGLTALAFTVDDMIGLAPTDRKERERLHGLSAALLSLTRSVEEAIIAAVPIRLSTFLTATLIVAT